MNEPRSLRQLLAVWLVIPLLALILLSAVPTYLVAVNAANDAYDNELLDPAIVIASYLRQTEDTIELMLPTVALEALRIDTADRLYFRVTGPDGSLIVNTADIPLPATPVPPAGQEFYDAQIGGDRVRVVALSVPRRAGTVTVQVAETYVKRNRLIKDMLLGSLVPSAVVVLAAAVLFWIGIRQSLAPLGRLKNELARRSQYDLAPVPEAGTLKEVRPLVAALNQLLARLSAAIGTQQRFIANAAHQLRTPLAGLRTHVELARRETRLEEIQALIEIIARETARTSHLANQLLTLARTEPGSAGTPARHPVNLRDIAARAVQEWVPRAVERNVDLGFELEDSWTRGDALQLKELLANLLDNALAYGAPGGQVTVRTRPESGRAELEVEDDGPGIPLPEAERVFERFYRMPGTPGDGCGLGLAIVREIADLHEGRVQLSPGNGSRGARITVSLPLIEPVPVSTPAPS